MTCSWGNSSSTVLSFLCLQKCVNDYLFIFGCLDCSLNNIFPEEGDLNILQHLTGSPCWAHGVAAAGPKASLRGDTDLQGRDRSAETQIQSEPLYWIPFFLPGTAVWITGKVPNLSHPSSSRHCAPSPELLQVPLQLAGKLYQDSRDYQGNSGEDQPKSSYFYIIDKVLKFLLAAGGLSVPRHAVRSGAAGTVVGNSVYSGFRQHWYSSQGQECLLILREKKESLKYAGRNGDGRAGPGKVFCKSLFLQIQNSLCIYYRITSGYYRFTMRFYTSWCQKREARGWTQYKAPGNGGILVFMHRWILHKGG